MTDKPFGDLCQEAFALLSSAARQDTAWWQAAHAWRGKWVTILAGAIPTDDPDDTRPVTSADVQLRYLQAAADAVDALVSTIELSDLADSEVGELHAKAAHLVGCAVSVDTMARGGELPTAWLRAWLRGLNPAPLLPAVLEELAVEGDREAAEQERYRILAGLRAGQPVVAMESVRLDERPPGFWGRIELPGMREYVGWISEEERFGQRGAVVRDWDGREINFVIPGPNAPVYHLPTPLRRPAEPDTPEDPFGEGFGSGYREHDPF